MRSFAAVFRITPATVDSWLMGEFDLRHARRAGGRALSPEQREAIEDWGVPVPGATIVSGADGRELGEAILFDDLALRREVARGTVTIEQHYCGR